MEKVPTIDAYRIVLADDHVIPRTKRRCEYGTFLCDREDKAGRSLYFAASLWDVGRGYALSKHFYVSRDAYFYGLILGNSVGLMDDGKGSKLAQIICLGRGGDEK